MTDRQEKPEGGRRNFLRMASVGTVASAAVALTSERKAEAAEIELGPNSAGYRETAHVKRVYDLSRF